jgi:hypothetical protein
MQIRLAVLLAMLATSGVLASGPSSAGVALVGCDLLTRGGPRVDYLQVDDSVGSGITIGIRPGDAVGRDCTEVLVEIQRDGFRFREFRVYGPELSRGLWFLTAKKGAVERSDTNRTIVDSGDPKPTVGILRNTR